MKYFRKGRESRTIYKTNLFVFIFERSPLHAEKFPISDDPGRVNALHFHQTLFPFIATTCPGAPPFFRFQNRRPLRRRTALAGLPSVLTGWFSSRTCLRAMARCTALRATMEAESGRHVPE
jgi:hypothetical protein